MAGYIGTQAVSVNTTSATISDDLAVGDDATITGDLDVDGTTNLDVVDIDGAVNMATTALVTGVLTSNGGAVFNEGSADVDFRVESNINTNALFVDGATGNVGIGRLPNVIGASGSGVLTVRNNGANRATIETQMETATTSGIYSQQAFYNGDTLATLFQHGGDGATDSGYLKIFTNANGGSLSEKLRIHGSGDLQIQDGNLVVALGHGINFAANANNSGMESELLDDYETGTFTMTLGQVSAGAFGIGRYVKVGRVVHFQWYSNGTINVDQGAGGGSFTGLPFTTDDDNASYGTFSSSHNTYCPTAANGYINVNGTSGVFTALNTTGGAAVSTGTGKYVMVAGTYRSKA